MFSFNLHKSRRALLLGSALSFMAGCDTMHHSEEPMMPMATSCRPLSNQPAGFGTDVDFGIAQTIVGVIGVAPTDGGGVTFDQQFAVIDGNASDKKIAAVISRLGKGRTGNVSYDGNRTIDAKGALDIDLNSVAGTKINGSTRMILSFAPRNWDFSTSDQILNFKENGNPNTTEKDEFFEASSCEKLGRTVSFLNRNATAETYFFNYEARIDGAQNVTIDPGTSNNGSGPTDP